MQTAVYWTAWADVLSVRQLLLRSRRRGGGPEQPQASDAARPSLCADACASLFRGGGEPGCRAAWMRSAITMPHTNAAARWPNEPRLQQWLVHTPRLGSQPRIGAGSTSSCLVPLGAVRRCAAMSRSSHLCARMGGRSHGYRSRTAP